MNGKNPTWYAFIRWTMKTAYFGTHGGIGWVGRDNIPAQGPILVAPVHISHLDPPAVAVGSTRRLRFMAKEELFKHPIFGRLIASLGAYPVKRGEGDTESIRRTIALLEEGEAVLIFPEGTRGDGKVIQEMSRGVAMLAKKTKAPVLPVGIVGTNRVMPVGSFKGEKFKVVIVFGKPFTYEEVATDSSEKVNRELFAKALQSRIADLCRANGMPLELQHGADAD